VCPISWATLSFEVECDYDSYQTGPPHTVRLLLLVANQMRSGGIIPPTALPI